MVDEKDLGRQECSGNRLHIAYSGMTSGEKGSVEKKAQKPVPHNTVKEMMGDLQDSANSVYQGRLTKQGLGVNR